MKSQIYNSIKKGFFGIILASFVFSSCNEYPEYTFSETAIPKSDFSIESDGLEITFQNEASHATTYLWDFGDGSTSTEKNPVHAFASKNSYTVTLTASDNNNVSDEFSNTLDVGFPKAGYTFVVDRATATFTNTSDNANSFVWDFGDGETSTEENPVHLYGAKGDYTVKLKAIDGTDEDIYEESIFVPGKFLPVFIAPSFEIDSYRSDWDWNGASGSGAPTPPDGGRGCKIKSSAWIGQTLQVDPGENYTIKFWFVTKKTTLPIGAKILIEDAQDPGIVLLDTSTGPSATSDDYEETSFSFNTGDSNSITVKIIYGDGETRVDLFSIE